MDAYSLENATRSFFDGPVSVSRQECDQLACSLLGGESVVPSAIQGQFSYTVFSPHAVPDGSSPATTTAKLVQFRLNKSTINIYVAHLAKAIHGDIAAETDYWGEIGQESGARLAVYTMQKLPGVRYVELGNFSVEMHLEQASNQLRTMEDLARYFAACWLHPQLVPQNQREHIRATISHKLSRLTSTLPPRFTATVSRAQRELGELFQPQYHQVLTHGDLCPMNILVSPTTGRITGIIDWAEAEVLPFGLALYGLENLLGYMGPGGWRYFAMRNGLEHKFWNQFWDCITDAKGPPEDSTRHAVTIAQQVGVLLQYGFEWESGIVERAVTDKDASSLAYLDAFLLTGERH